MSAFEVGKPAPHYCNACQAVPQAGYCKMAGCPAAPGDDLDLLGELPDLIAGWLFSQRGIHLSVAEARRCARAALTAVGV